MALPNIWERCFICGSDNHVDKHHYDCNEGKLSSETVPLCRRCHRTYHDLGIEWFEDEYLDKAIEIENRHRQIVYDSLVNPVKTVQLMTRDDIKRTAYWYKKHGIKPEHPIPSVKDMRVPAYTFHLPRNEPLCGWDWVHQHIHDLAGWIPRIEITCPGLELAIDIDSRAKHKDTVGILRGLKQK